MFGNKSSETLPAPGGSSISNRVNHGTTMEGTIDSDGDIRVEGTIRGTMRVKARVAVGTSGLIEGDIYCKTADVEGRIIGDIEVSDLLTLKSTAVVEGNIYSNKIVVENGARFNGLCSMGSKEKHQNVERTLAAIEKEAVS